MITGVDEPLFVDFQSHVVLLQVLDKLADMDFTDDEVDSSLWGAWFCTLMPRLKSLVCCNATCYNSFIIDRHSMFRGLGPARYRLSQI